MIRMSISVPSKGNRKNRITEVHLIGKPLYLRRASPLTRITVLDAANQVQLPVGAKGTLKRITITSGLVYEMRF